MSYSYPGNDASPLPPIDHPPIDNQFLESPAKFRFVNELDLLFNECGLLGYGHLFNLYQSVKFSQYVESEKLI